MSLAVLGYQFETTVYFADDPGIARNVLGRIGWLDRLAIAIIHYEGRLYLSDYDSLEAIER